MSITARHRFRLMVDFAFERVYFSIAKGVRLWALMLVNRLYSEIWNIDRYASMIVRSSP
jgi:hypothetical protein